MDEFDFKEEKPAGPPRKFGSALLNLGSLITLLATLCAGGYFTQIFLDPQSDLNPLPPFTSVPTAAATQTSILPTAEPTSDVAPTATLEPTATVPAITYAIQEGSPAALDAAVFRPELACNFLGVFGQAFGLDDAPITGLRVQVTGTLNGQPVDKLGLTGAASQYGAGAYYEIQLANAPAASDNTLSVVLLDEAGQALSIPATFSTSSECSQNLILINFKQQP
jgi:hypothetical protein